MASSTASWIPEEALSSRSASCPLCGQTGERRPILDLQVEPRVELVECRACRGLSADRMPDPELLARFYEPTHYRSSLVSQAGLSRRCARAILRGMRLERDRPISILDYGGSDGALSRAIRHELLVSGHRGDVESTVVDLHPREDSPHQRFIDPERFEKSTDRHDLLLASAVLEHLPSPAGAIRSLIGSARPDAFLYARTPWDAPLQRLAPGYRVKWPRHLHDMGPAFWERFMTVFGVSGELLVSRPSIVETSFREAPMRTALAHLSKAPARLENVLRRRGPETSDRLWRLVGGWEVLIRLS